MKCYEIDLSNLIKVTMLDRQEFYPPQQHITRYTSEYIVYVIEEGSLSIVSDAQQMELSAGDVCVFGKDEYQMPIVPTECKFYYLHFDVAGFSEYEMSEDEYCAAIRERKMRFIGSDIYGASAYDNIKVLLRRRVHISDPLMRGVLIDILKNNSISYGYNTPEWRLGISNAVAGFLMRLEDMCYDGLERGYSGKNGRVYSTVKKIVDYIEEHFRENFDSAAIERDLLINFDYANRIFKKHTGYSIIKYRNRLRINTAKALIFTNPLTDIASEVGFSSVYYFSRCFKNFEGVSPEKYREFVKMGEGQKVK